MKEYGKAGFFMTGTRKVLEVIKSLVAAYIVTGIALAILAFVIYKWNLNETVANLVILVIYGVACLLGGFLTGRRVKERRFLWGFILGACYILIIYGVSLVLSATMNLVSTASVLAAVLCLAGGTLGGMLS
jgi:putative membrane protein (TIGR04086 family)